MAARGVHGVPFTRSAGAGKKLNPGDKVFKSSKIDLVLGDGNVGFDEKQLDSLAIPKTPVNAK